MGAQVCSNDKVFDNMMALAPLTCGERVFLEPSDIGMLDRLQGQYLASQAIHVVVRRDDFQAQVIAIFVSQYADAKTSYALGKRIVYSG